MCPASASRVREALAREPEPRAAAGVGRLAVFERERAAVVFGDLAAEHQADAGALRLSGEKRDEEILETGDAGAVVLDRDFEHAAIEVPGQADARFGVAGGALFEGGIDGRAPDGGAAGK